MREYCFINDLEIENYSCLSEDETEDSLNMLEKKLKKELYDLSEEYSSLKKKIEEKNVQIKTVQEKLSRYQKPHMDIVLGTPTLTKSVSMKEKAEFLYKLFHGRRDVYAIRRWNKEKNRTSYFPNCINAWTVLCPRKQQKENGTKGNRIDCSECQNKCYEALSPELIVIRQLSNSDEHGNKAIGIYPMLQGNICRFVAVDFDEETWAEDVLTVADIARKSGFQAAIERSFSGNGAHLWLFFSEDIPASMARKLVFSFLDKACEISKTVNLASYDRVFPTQDMVEKNGLGNLILLPLLLSAARRQENKGTVFVDNDFEVYPDQIAFLSSLPRYSQRDIELYLISKEASSFELNGDMDFSSTDVLWSRTLPKLSSSDCLIKKLPVFLSAGISIPKSSMSPKLQNALKRMTSFANPEYYKTVTRNKGYVSEKISSTIQTSIESDSVLQLPRGFYKQFVAYMQKSNILCEVNDIRTVGTKLNASFIGKLNDEQIPAVQVLLEHDIGILKAATSFGKTVVAAKIIAERKEKTLILVQNINLLKQWKNKIEEFLVIENKPEKREGKRLNKSKVGMYSGSKDSVCGLVDIATFQSVASRMPEFIRDYGLVIVDECHHGAADSFEKVLQSVRPRYLYGLSATVKRDDGLEKIVYAQCGNEIFEYKASRLADLRGIAQTIVPRFTASTVSNQTGRTFNHVEAVKELSSDEVRNNLIISDALSLINENHKILVLSNLVDHTLALEKGLNLKGIDVVSITGSMNKSEQSIAHDKIEKGKCSVIISTIQYLGEGTDIPYLDTLMLATPVSWEGVVSQCAGRIARKFEGKKQTRIYDYVDINVPQFARMYIKRLSAYRKLGYSLNPSVLETGKVPVDTQGLFYGRSFYSQFDIFDPFVNSIKCAKFRIVISSPEIFISSVTKEIINELLSAMSKGIIVEIRTKSIGDSINQDAQKEALDFLKEHDIQVVCSSLDYLRFATMDSSEVWFGDINLLGGAIKKRQINEVELKVMMHIYSSDASEALNNSKIGLL